MTNRCASTVLLAVATVVGHPAYAQTVETVGSRALGMGGAFVAVADDSSATWWNPAGLAAGPFLDLALARAVGGAEARRERASWLSVGTPPFGFSYYRLRLTYIRPTDPTAGDTGDREDRRAEVPVASLSASQLGATLVHTLLPGVHAGATVKYVRGTVRATVEDAGLDSSELLRRGDDLEGGDSEGEFDADLGILAVAGSFRAGVVARNVAEPRFAGVRLPRQVRGGVAFDGDRAGLAPLILAVDADLREYETAAGVRQVVAAGAEHWFASRRLAVRGGGRVNLAGARERAATAGVSVAVRAALYLDAHVVRGGADDERGWGVAARVSF